MAKMLIATGDNVPQVTNGLRLSMKIPLALIKEHPKFKEIFHMDPDLLERIKDNMLENKYDESQIVHIWESEDERWI